MGEDDSDVSCLNGFGFEFERKMGGGGGGEGESVGGQA